MSSESLRNALISAVLLYRFIMKTHDKMIDSSQLPRKHMCDANPSQNALNELKYESFQGVMCRNH
ncbi:hypothetical protein T09_12294 [Trichinella sp. T9]|nr:hypothetical protein T09_12294 [Trichinella sp. T9]